MNLELLRKSFLYESVVVRVYTGTVLCPSDDSVSHIAETVDQSYPEVR